MFFQYESVNPWEPQQPVIDPEYWLQIHESYVKETQNGKNEIKVVFIGASIVQHWLDEGSHIWNGYYRGKGCVNYGISGDTIQNVLWRLHNRAVEGLDPKIVVLQCGTNNIEPFGPPTEEDIGRGFEELVKQLRQRLSNSKILVIGILPINDSVFQSKAKRINELIARNADELNVFFLDLTPNMSDSSGRQKPGLFTDGLHLSDQGYNVWHQCMQPLFERLYN